MEANKKFLSLYSLALATLAVFGCTESSDAIYSNSQYSWKGNTITQGEFTATASSATDITSNYSSETPEGALNYMPSVDDGIDHQHWTLKRDISHLPHYTSSNLIDNALFNMSLEESELAIEADSTFRTGVYWGGVWTRDVSYSILHSLAQLQPEVSMNCLRAKINPLGRIIQDTGTGGAWPCSTDRTTWILAAWEVYKVTGDKNWLDTIYPVIKNSIEDDRHVAYDPKNSLMRGETSWLDWREQEYPTWMQPADIYQSEAMNTNAVHYQSLRILSEICSLEGAKEDSDKYASWAEDLKKGMNENLWMEDKGLYGIYLYGREHMVLHPQMEILAEAFSILFDIADEGKQKRISQNMVSEEFGTPDFYPNLKDQYPYHNDAMWPFTQGYWIKAQAKVGNEKGVLHGISSIYRYAAMSLTNYENMVIYNGSNKGLPINSARQLWSVAADISIVPNVYFGISYELDGIHFNPFVAKALAAQRELSNFKYRDAVLDMKISGYGNKIKSFKIDGVKSSSYIFPADLSGEHTIEIVLSNSLPKQMEITLLENDYQPATPVLSVEGSLLKWQECEGSSEYIILKDGKEMQRTGSTEASIDGDGEYSVIAMGQNGYPSYMSEPVTVANEKSPLIIEVESSASPFEARKATDPALSQSLKTLKKSGNAILLSKTDNTALTIPVEIEEDGTYAIDFRYANGNGPVNTENKCCTRLLEIDGEEVGAFVFPHRGTDEWNNWGWTNVLTTSLSKGKHEITLEFNDFVQNMNIEVNQALVDYIRIVKID